MDSPAVMVLGASGMLGHAVVRALADKAGCTVFGTQVEDATRPWHLDAEAPPELWGPAVRHSGCSYIVNCIGVLKAATREDDPAALRRAIAVNALFPHFLAEVAAQAGARVIHMSTDGVFAGRRSGPYFEDDPTDCPDAYGKTKALGESPASNVLNIRCSIVGRDPVWRRGLVERVLRSPDGAELQGFDDQTWNGVTTAQFASLCRFIVTRGCFDAIRCVSGVHHFCPNAAITKYELICMVRQAARKNVVVRRTASGVAHGTRLLASRFGALRELYPGGAPWPELIEQAVTDLPE